MSCQTFTSGNYARTYSGKGLKVVTGSDACQQLGYTRMLTADCWEVGSEVSEGYGGWCLWNNETYSITTTPTACSKCSPDLGNVDPNKPCDCVNGGCVSQNTYGTPGAFPNLAACQSGCAKNSNCTGECVDPAEIAALQQAASALQSKICK